MAQNYIDQLNRHKVKLPCVKERCLFSKKGVTCFFSHVLRLPHKRVCLHAESFVEKRGAKGINFISFCKIYYYIYKFLD